ncbi:MAG: zinc ribbon domain-containing protein, partial [Thermoguttaceae bacterium]|nr:zinc ribbon domain-containing protein [Thermoguttaceae bacterium]
MNRCPFCNAKNKTSALFCSQCGKEFCVVDVGSNRDDPLNSESFFRRRNDGTRNKGAGGWSAFVDAFSWLSRVAIIPLAGAALRVAVAATRRAFDPAATWNPTRPPNFLYW